MAVRLSEYDLESRSDRGESAPNIRLLTKDLKLAKWQTLGIHLGMTEDEIREIEQDHPGNTARRRTAMLDKWLRKEENPSWMSIIEALESMSEVNLAKKIRKKYMNLEHMNEVPAKPRSKLNLVQKLKKKIGFPAAWPQPSRTPAHEAQQISTDKVHVVELHRSDTISQWIENLWDKYFQLVKEIESGLKSANPSSSDIRVFSQVYMCDEVSTVEELFDQLKPFHFFDYALLEKISKCLLKQELSKLNDYIRELQEFKKSTTVQQFMENIETAHNESPQTCTVTIQLVGSWLPKTISDLEKLLTELFRKKAALLTRLKIVQKCVLVTYLVQCSEAKSHIEAAQAKISFMMKVGVCVLQVGDTVVTSTQNETSGFSFESSLIRSVKENDNNVLSFLLDTNTNPDATDDEGQTGCCKHDGVTPLFIASLNGNSDVVSILLKANANPNLRRDDGETPLMVASKYGYFAIVVLLLNADANPNHQNDKGTTPLMIACLNRHPKIVQLLLTNGADPDLRDSNNSTALDHSGCLESRRLLLTFGTDSFSQTPDTIDEGT